MWHAVNIDKILKRGQVAGPVKMGPRRYPEKLATDYQPKLHNIPEGRRRDTFVSAYEFQERLLLLSLSTAFKFFLFTLTFEPKINIFVTLTSSRKQNFKITSPVPPFFQNKS